MSTLLLFAFGIIIGELADIVYDRLNDQNIEGESALLHWLEHYHWGLILFFLYDFPDAYALESIRGWRPPCPAHSISGLG